VHKSTKAYVEQKTCTAMEALEELGNAVHRTLENMMEVLDEVPQELHNALQHVAGGTAQREC
jgi:prefoldin subunit 5